MKHISLKKIAYTACALFIFMACVGMGGKGVDPGEVATISKMSISDSEVVSQNRPLMVTFSEPMVSEDQVDKEVAEDKMPFTVSPKVKGNGTWLTTSTFALVPTEAYPRGRQYYVLFKEDLTSLDGKPVRYYFSFRTESVEMQEMWTQNYDNSTGEQPLVIYLNRAVKAEALRTHLTITDPAGTVLPFAMEDPERDGSQHVVRIKMDKDLAAVKVQIVTDKDDDKIFLGFAKEYKASVSLQRSTNQPAVQSEDSSPIYFYNPYGSEDDNGPYAYFPMSESIASDQDYKPFIVTKPEMPFSLYYGGSYLRFNENLEPGQVLSVTLKPGLVDSQGRVLKEERTATYTVPDLYPAARFVEPGNYLTPVYGSKVALELTNLDRVAVSMHRVYDNNLPFMNLYSENTGIARSLEYKSVDISLEKNVKTRRAIDLAEIAKGKKGVFILSVTGYEKVTYDDGDVYYRYADESSRVVVLSDIGITSRVYPAGATVFANSLSTGKPLPGASVRLYSSSNQLVAEGKTNANGLLTITRSENWDPQLMPNVATVSTADDISFLPLVYDTRVYLEDNAVRPYLGNGYEAFLYTPRGVFRPGETVDVKAFVRDKDRMVPPVFPVMFSITSSRGLEISRGSVKLSPQGGADYSLVLPTSAPTGEYSAKLFIPGQENSPIGWMNFQVEDFVPPRLEVSVTPVAETFVKGDSLSLDLSGQYLFGAPGDGLSYELGYRMSPRTFAPEGWEGYLFADTEVKQSSSFDLTYITGSLNGEGHADISFSAPSWELCSIANVQIVGSVQEDGGRWVTQTGNVTYFPKEYLLGIKVDDALALYKDNIIQVAAVDPDGKVFESAGELDVEIFRVRGAWHTVYRNGRYTYDWSENLQPVYNGSLKNPAGLAEFAFKPETYGNYLIRVAAKDGEVTASRRVSVWGEDGYNSEEGGGRMDLVELSLDKKTYLPGDIAKLSVKAPYAGTLLLGIERGEHLYSRVINMSQPSLVVDVPVTGEMDPNATITAWVYRPVTAKESEWYAHRAYANVSLEISKAPYKLAVNAETPERALPDTPLSIPFKVTDALGRPVAGEFSVALVDEGILSLTGFKTPDPLAFFMAKRASTGTTYDGFDLLLKPEAKATPLLTPGGGAAEDDYQGSLSTQQVFLAGFLPTVKTDAEGMGRAVFDIPEYSGKGRLMIVGAAGNTFASAFSQVRFARDIVVEAAAPRAVAPGDVFDVSIKTFTMADAMEGEAEIRVEAEGPIVLSGDLVTKVSLGNKDPGAKNKPISIKATAENSNDVAAILIHTSVAGREDLDFTKRVEVVVRSPYPRTSMLKTALIKAGSAKTLAFDGKWMDGTVKTSLSVTGSPVFSVLPALEYLREYPHGCLEQTVSRAWPYLTLPEVQKALYPDIENSGNMRAALEPVVARIASMQTSEGGFAMWPGYTSPDAWKSVHATFFLVEAKSQVPVPSGTLKKSLSYMKLLLAASDGYFSDEYQVNTTKAYAAFVLTRAGEAPLAWMQHLASRQDKMHPSGRIFLATAISLQAGNPAALRELKEDVLKFNPSAYGFNESLESGIRNLSLLLMGWSMVAPGDPETERFCLALAEKIGKSRWLTTQDAGMASMAFGYYLKNTGLAGKKHDASVTVGGMTFNSKDGEPLLLGNAVMPLDDNGNPEPASVAVSGEGQAYVTYTVRGVNLEPPAASNNELELRYTWYGPDGNQVAFEKALAKLAHGDRITAKVQIRSSRDLSDVALSILLPGGLEVENPNLKTSGGQKDYFGGYMDLREDRLLLFYDYLNAGGDWKTYEFSMRAVSKGSFVVPPVAAEGMYAPQSYAITNSAKVIIE